MKTVLATLLLVLVAGCGGESFESAHAVAKAGGCSKIVADESMASEKPWADLGEFVTCQLNGHELVVGWFKSDDALADLKKDRESLGLGDDDVAWGKRWVVKCNDDRADCDEFVAAIG